MKYLDSLFSCHPTNSGSVPSRVGIEFRLDHLVCFLAVLNDSFRRTQDGYIHSREEPA